MSADVLEPKRGVNVGRVVVPVVIENYGDVERAEAGQMSRDQVRRVQVDAPVDTGATFLCVPKSLVDQLGLSFVMNKECEDGGGADHARHLCSSAR